MDKTTFVERAKLQLAEWNADLAGMRVELELADGPVRTDIQDKIDTFMSHRALAEATLDKINNLNAQVWAEKGSGIQTAWARLEQGFARARFSSR